jgi:hypothetical protein
MPHGEENAMLVIAAKVNEVRSDPRKFNTTANETRPNRRRRTSEYLALSRLYAA